MYVCMCHGVTDKQILDEARRGCANLDDLSMRTGCGSNCGCCREMAAQLIESARPASNVVPLFAHAA